MIGVDVGCEVFVEHEVGDEFAAVRAQLQAGGPVPGCEVDVPGAGDGAEYGQEVFRAGAQADADFTDFSRGQAGRHPERFGEDLPDPGGRGAGGEAGPGFARGADDHPVVRPGYHVVAAKGGDDAPRRGIGGSGQAQVDDLTALGFYGDVNVQLAAEGVRPGAAGDRHSAGRDGPSVRDNTGYGVVPGVQAFNAGVLDGESPGFGGTAQGGCEASAVNAGGLAVVDGALDVGQGGEAAAGFFG